jgi:hypothetical protein
MSTMLLEAVCALDLPTGRLTVQDPGWPVNPEIDDSMVVATVAPGTYEVVLSVLRCDPTAAEPEPVALVAAAAVRVKTAPVETWRPARPHPEAPSRALGFSVDGGVGCFADEAAQRALAELQADPQRLFDTIQRVGEEQPWVAVPDDDQGAQLVLFECGMGDGVYPVWLGRDAGGDITMVVADLELLRHGVAPA